MADASIVARPVATRTRSDASIVARFVRLSDLRAIFTAGSELPSFRENSHLCQPRESFDTQKTWFVYVSHRWLRPAQGHPDDEGRNVYQLILKALERLVGESKRSSGALPAGVEIAVWHAYCCVDPDGALASELHGLASLLQSCDLVLTPVVDHDHTRWALPQAWGDIFRHYHAEGWKEHWTRAWCRLEAMLAAMKPVAHALYGSKESADSDGMPIFLPPLPQHVFEEYAPEQGALSNEADRVTVLRLATEARKAVSSSSDGSSWGGNEGHGRHPYKDGTRMDWDCTVCHGGQPLTASGRMVGLTVSKYFLWDANKSKLHPDQTRINRIHESTTYANGKHTYANGTIYEGEWAGGKHHGYGTLLFASRDHYEGQFYQGEYHGTGSFVFAHGDRYTGQFHQGRYHGEGRQDWAAGGFYEGGWQQGRHPEKTPPPA